MKHTRLHSPEQYHAVLGCVGVCDGLQDGSNGVSTGVGLAECDFAHTKSTACAEIAGYVIFQRNKPFTYVLERQHGL
jgi:hypothetical protein